MKSAISIEIWAFQTSVDRSVTPDPAISVNDSWPNASSAALANCNAD